jgi:hypothetical protein
LPKNKRKTFDGSFFFGEIFFWEFIPKSKKEFRFSIPPSRDAADKRIAEKGHISGLWSIK